MKLGDKISREEIKTICQERHTCFKRSELLAPLLDTICYGCLCGSTDDRDPSLCLHMKNHSLIMPKDW